MNKALKVEGIYKSFGKRAVLTDLSFEINSGEVFALLGRSGCGKSTTLNLIAGLEPPDKGSIILGKNKLNSDHFAIPAHERKMGMVFQGQMLWPHMTVKQHLSFVLSAQSYPTQKRAGRIDELLKTVHLLDRKGAYPSELSGGERQRLTITRALAAEPEMLLLDEPCANLDAPLKQEFLNLLTTLRETHACTTLYVTHDATEATFLANRIGVMSAGKFIQCATPQELHQHPNALEVARLIANGIELQGTVTDNGTIQTTLGPIQQQESKTAKQTGDQATIFLQPEDLALTTEGEPTTKVKQKRFQSDGWSVLIHINETPVWIKTNTEVEAGQQVSWKWARQPWIF